MSVFHLALASEWKAGWRDGRYTPARFAADGFVHCCDDEATTLKVATAYFAEAKDVLVAELDETTLDVELRREAPAPPDGQPHAHHAGKTFPHVYGSLPARAVVRIGPLVRDARGAWGWPTHWTYGKP